MPADRKKWRLAVFNQDGDIDVELLKPGKKPFAVSDDLLHEINLVPDADGIRMLKLMDVLDNLSEDSKVRCGIESLMRLAFDAGRHLPSGKS